MTTPLPRRITAGIAALAIAGLGLSACGDDSDSGSPSAGGTAPGAGKPECAQLESFGDLTGKTVSVYTSIVAPEDAAHKASYKVFEDCTGATVSYEGSQEFEAQLQVRAQAGNLPDIAYIPQPGLVKSLVEAGYVKEAPQSVSDNVDEFFGEDWKAYGTVDGKFYAAPQSVSDNVDEFFGEDWKAYGTVDGKFYAAPLGANVKSFVWYSPKMFADNGWEVPTTWDDMMALSDTIAASGVKPWCAGIESGEATGWVLTDWLEDVMLREVGPDVYDQWVNHEIPFNDPQVAAALDTVGGVLKDENYVNGGIGGVTSIATTSFQEGGLPILKGECAMHRQASFYAAQWGEGVKVAEDGDVFAFYLPTENEDFGKPVLGGGEFVTAFSDRPEVQAFQTYLSSDVWANEKAKATPGGGWVSANKGLDIANLNSPIDQLSASILQDPDATFRFDGSDQMPSAVGAGTFWSEMTNWISGDSTSKVLDAIESSWPA